jgi:hypothetical protein
VNDRPYPDAVLRSTRHIEFVFIPASSPTSNLIEPLWKDLKHEISPTIFEGKAHFREFVTETFFQLSHRLSFAVD